MKFYKSFLVFAVIHFVFMWRMLVCCAAFDLLIYAACGAFLFSFIAQFIFVYVFAALFPFLWFSNKNKTFRQKRELVKVLRGKTI